MVVDVERNTIAHHTFRDLPNFLRPGDALVLNETKVFPARVRPESRPAAGWSCSSSETGAGSGRRVGGSGEASKRLRPNLVLSADGEQLRLVKSLGDGHWVVSGADLPGLLRRRGRMPLPPYIRPTLETEERYQTVYARNEGSAAAPTAGFHFTERVLGERKEPEWTSPGSRCTSGSGRSCR